MLVGIAGLGVIGGSIGLSLRSHGKAVTVGFDIDRSAASEALEIGCVDSIAGSMAELDECDWIVVSVPPHAVKQCLDKVDAIRKPESIVTDCASVKGFVKGWIVKDPERENWFIGGHPMAGNEGSGPGCADSTLFAGSKWIVTPTSGTPAGLREKLSAFIRSLGATPVEMSADDHDRHVALLSHAPHALAAALMQLSSSLESPEVASGSWRDLTRVAGSNPELWQHILVENKQAVSETLDGLIGHLSDLKAMLKSGDGEAIRGFFENARQIKRRQGGLH